MTTENTFDIPSHNLAILNAKVAKLNKRAAKNGLDGVAVFCGTPYNKEIKAATDDEAAAYLEYTPVTVYGVTPVIEGWKIIGSVEHVNGVSLISNAPNVEHIDDKYRCRAAYCDHCNTKRVKKYSYIIEDIKTGETKQVGKSCLKDFLNSDIQHQLAYLQWFTAIIDELEDEESEYYGHGASYNASVEDILEWAAFAIREWGYQKSDSSSPTKYVVSNLLWNPRARKNENGPDFVPTAEDIATSKATVAWINELEPTNDYQTTLKDLVRAGAVPERFFGYVVSAIVVYLKVDYDVKAKAVQAEKPVLDEYIGTVKVRELFELQLEKILAFDGAYGTTYLHIFTDVDGRSLTWWGSKYLLEVDGEKMNQGTKVRVKATVKEHKVYNERKQTVLTRVAQEAILEDFTKKDENNS